MSPLSLSAHNYGEGIVKRIYLDNNATTPVDPIVLKAYAEATDLFYANPSSIHYEGRQAKRVLIEARQGVAHILGARTSDVVFFSSATEALNTLIMSVVSSSKKKHIITSSIEHPAVSERMAKVAKEQPVTFLSTGPYGAVTRALVEEHLREDTGALFIISANNETGALAELEEIALLAFERKIPLIVDAVAHIGKAPFHFYPGISAVVFSGHKIHAPKGIAAAVLRSSLKFEPLLLGGPQESNRRAGTENVAGAIALAKALSIFHQSEREILEYVTALRDRFECRLFQAIKSVSINGEAPRVSNSSNLAFHGVEGEWLLMQLDLKNIAASHGSACSSGSLEPSKVLLNMGLSRERVLSSLRFSFSRMNTLEEVDQAVDVIGALLQQHMLY